MARTRLSVRLRAVASDYAPDLLLTAGTALLMAAAVATALSVWP